VRALSARGFEIGLFTLSLPVSQWYNVLPNVSVLYSMDNSGSIFAKGGLSKLKYISAVPRLKKVLREFNPDILHAHYATSYGLIGALSGFHPYIVSAWGSDVMDFPHKSYFHKRMLRYNFGKANIVLATSNAIETIVNAMSSVETRRIPFGIDTEIFKPMQVERMFPNNSIVIGTIKSLEIIYGIDILIKAFKITVEKNSGIDLRLLLVGGGTREADLKALVKEQGLEAKVVYTGKVEYSLVPEYHNRMDIFVNVSRNESFGVAVLESSASGKPVIASNIGGLKEVVLDGETGILVAPENVEATAAALSKLVGDKMLRDTMGAKGRAFVKKEFEFANNVDDMVDVYEKLISVKL
jgi:glycosyltransferase involved in cell wall biosynthesis